MRNAFICLFVCLHVFSLTAATRLITPDMADVETPMDDGTLLRADVYLPEGTGAWPVVLGRTPYDKTSDSGSQMLPDDAIVAMNDIGIAVMIQDVRGRYASDGDEIAFVADAWDVDQHDGQDTVEWLLAQSWCNGTYMTTGASAGGVTQILLDGTGTTAPVGQIIGLAPISLYNGFAYYDGTFREEMVEGWLGTSLWPFWENLNLIRAHPLYDEHWQGLDLTGRIERVDWPVVINACWYDLFLQGSIDLYTEIRTNAGPTARENVTMIIGPYTHTTWGLLEQGELQLPDNASVPYGAHWIREMDLTKHWLLETDLPFHQKRVIYYVMGETAAIGEPKIAAPGNEWRVANDWPPPSTPLRFYLTASHELQTVIPAAGSLGYTYDPNDPVPTIGGQNFLAYPGPYDQAGIESRSDVLIFDSGVLPEPLEATGRISVELYVATTGADTDFTAKLTDVYPDGRSMLVVDGVRTLSLRDGFTTRQEVTSGTVHRLPIDLGSAGIVFNKGHKIRLAVSSSNSPRFEANPNTGNPGSVLKVVADQTVYFGGMQASYMELPFVPEYTECIGWEKY